MKKFITFSNFMVLLGIMTILFYLIPAVKISVDTVNTTSVNLFTATFGGPFEIGFAHQPLVASGGLVVAFVFGIIAILLTLLKFKVKFATLFAFPFYVTSGVLVACTTKLVTSVNFSSGQIFSYATEGGATTVTVFYFILAAFALIDFITVIAKPKQQPVAY